MEFTNLSQQDSDLVDTVNIVGSTVGRKKSKIWEHYKPLNHARAECVHCKESVRARPGTSMKTHLSTCVIARASNIDPGLLNPELIDKKITKLKKEKKKFLTSEFDNKKANNLLSKFLFTSGAPFSILNSPDFKDFLNFLNKSFKPFSKKNFIESILNENLIAYETRMNESLQNTKFITINIDCWSTSGKKGSLYGVVATLSDGEEFLLDILEMGSEPSAADNLLNKLDDIIVNLNPKKVIAIVTDDGGSGSVSSFSDKLSQKHPNIFQVLSFVHTLNLLCISFFKNQYIDKTLRDVSDLLGVFSKDSRLRAKFKDAQLAVSENASISPLASARFLRVYHCLSTLSENEASIITSNSETAFGERPKDLVEDDLFWKDIRDLVRILEPLYTVIKLADSATMTLSDAYFYLTKISFTLSSALRDRISHCGNQMEIDLYKPLYFIISKYLNDPVFQLCTILDCRYQVDFSNKTISKIKKFLKLHLEKRGASKPLIERCISNFELFTLNRKLNKNHPTDFWELNYEYSTLSPFAFSLFNIVANSISCERAFSNLGYINFLRRSGVARKTLVGFTKIHSHMTRQNKQKENSSNKNEQLSAITELLDYNVLQKLNDISDPFPDSIPIEMADLLKNIVVIFTSNEAVKDFIKRDEKGKPLSLDNADQEMLGLMF
ncbi:hypothetical protein BVG19_g2611 [[Candida] boidinii]|nr:hypothetical protein BVG19_g2611 [[Candida] boidinii]OWB48634.1 hypothetical protein B5S27_g169 [[Candida] boidinii]OWB86315.1 hypothetical protein B5S33_g5001 [[Candida] boidinii]